MNFAALCREFGISRQQGYMWCSRHREAGHRIDAVVARSSRPHAMPTRIAEEVADVVVAARKAKPTWGPKKLRAWLLHHHPELEVPASSTMGRCCASGA